MKLNPRLSFVQFRESLFVVQEGLAPRRIGALCGFGLAGGLHPFQQRSLCLGIRRSTSRLGLTSWLQNQPLRRFACEWRQPLS